MKDLYLLVNKSNRLSGSYCPGDLFALNENKSNDYIDKNYIPLLRKIVLKDYYELKKHALKDKLNFAVESGFRSYDYQMALYIKYVKEYGLDKTSSLVAYPGTSEHQTGLAIDFCALEDEYFSRDLNNEERLWLQGNCYKHGFILRYPSDKENITGYEFEPWHYRYVGKSLANHLTENDLTLEEYYLKLKK